MANKHTTYSQDDMNHAVTAFLDAAEDSNQGKIYVVDEDDIVSTMNEYTAGDGISISKDNAIKVNIADDLGGLEILNPLKPNSKIAVNSTIARTADLNARYDLLNTQKENVQNKIDTFNGFDPSEVPADPGKVKYPSAGLVYKEIYEKIQNVTAETFKEHGKKQWTLDILKQYFTERLFKDNVFYTTVLYDITETKSGTSKIVNVDPYPCCFIQTSENSHSRLLLYYKHNWEWIEATPSSKHVGSKIVTGFVIDEEKSRSYDFDDLAAGKEISKEIGDIAELTTKVKTTLVDAVNYLDKQVGDLDHLNSFFDTLTSKDIVSALNKLTTIMPVISAESDPGKFLQVGEDGTLQWASVETAQEAIQTVDVLPEVVELPKDNVIYAVGPHYDTKFYVRKNITPDIPDPKLDRWEFSSSIRLDSGSACYAVNSIYAYPIKFIHNDIEYNELAIIVYGNACQFPKEGAKITLKFGYPTDQKDGQSQIVYSNDTWNTLDKRITIIDTSKLSKDMKANFDKFLSLNATKL